MQGIQPTLMECVRARERGFMTDAEFRLYVDVIKEPYLEEDDEEEDEDDDE